MQGILGKTTHNTCSVAARGLMGTGYAIMIFMASLIVMWILAALLFCCGLFFIVVNYTVIYLAKFKNRHSSPAGLVGGGLCALALLLCPVKEVGVWFWVPLVLDPGCLFLVCAFIYVVLFKGALK